MSKENSQAREFAESLSALMDNESTELDLRRLLKEMPSHPEIAQTWDRYNLTRSLLHKEVVRPVSAAGTLAMLEALAAEVPYGGITSSPSDVARNTWFQAAGRIAIAASVALAVFVGLQTFVDQSIPEGAMAQRPSAPVEENSEALAITPTAIAGDTGFDADAQQRLNAYIRGVSIQYREDAAASPGFNILQDSQLIRQVNQIEN